MNASTRLRDLAIRHGVYLERYTKAQAKELRQILTQAANEIEAKIRATGGQFTKDRLEALLRDTRNILAEATNQQIQPKLFSAVDELAVYELEQGQSDLRRAIPAQIELTSPDPNQVMAAVRFNPTAGGALLTDLFKKWSEATADAFVTKIRLGVVQGETVQQLARRIRGEVVARASRNRPGVYEGGVLQTTTRGAETLVRTAVAHVNAQARDELYKANEDLIKSYQYVATLDAATCLVCGPIDGKEYPDLESAPVVPQHFNCLPGDALISSSSDITAVSIRLYEGDMFIIRTASGNEIMATPNHPILTSRGFVEAKNINKLDNLICDNGIDRVCLIGENEDNTQSRIEDFSSAFLKSSNVSAVIVPTTSKDFHGDAVDNEVAVIASNRELIGKINLLAYQNIGEFSLVMGSSARVIYKPSSSHFIKFLFCFLSAFRRNVRRLGKIINIFFASVFHPFNLLFLAVPRLNAVFKKHIINRGSGKPKASSDTSNTNTRSVKSQDIVKQGWSLEIGCVNAADSTALDESVDRIMGDTELSRQIINGSAGNVRADNVVSITKKDFSGHVYNLQTKLGWFIANGIITHNCRCSILPVLKSFRELGIDIDEIEPGTRASMDGQVPEKTTYAEWLKSRPESEQKDILGPGRYDLFSRGLPLADMRSDAGKVVNLDALRQLDES